MRVPLRVTFVEENQAFALARELGGLDGLDVHANGSGWKVEFESLATQQLVRQVLDAVSRVLDGSPQSTALVQIDGHEYHVVANLTAAQPSLE